MIQEPLFPHVGVCALVPDSWAETWQPRHYVLEKLARYFHVVWVNPACEWREIFRDLARQNSYDTNTLRPPGLIIYAPEFWLPVFYRPQWLARFTFDTRLKHARRLLTSRGCRKIIIYLWRPGFMPALASIPYDLSCYHVDDEYSFSEVEVPPDPVEMAVLAKVDQVFIHSPELLERKGHINRNTTFVPNGVEYQLYAEAVEEPEDLSGIPHPRIGYTGYIKKQLDWCLIQKLANQHREWSFVFVGPRSPHPEITGIIDELSSYPNVYFLGPKSVRDLAAYPQHFDTCIMPYCVDAYTNNIYPLKLHEYLASGRPVVSVPIRSLRDFVKVVALADGVDEWSKALTRSLEPVASCPHGVAARRKIAREYDWDKLVHLIAQTLCERLGSEYVQQFNEIASRDYGVNHTLHNFID